MVFIEQQSRFLITASNIRRCIIHKQNILMGLTMVLLLLMAGCTAAIVGGSERAYSHVRGDLLGIVPEPLEKAYPASVKALEDLERYEITEREVNIINGHIVAYDPQARKVKVDLSKTEHNQTRISIRIGLVGDRVESILIYDRIQHYLRLDQ
ncbi:MAG: DUF3568 family protein [Sedimentisphaerales bacterium]|nr:DUF3568 family protein [Sedimentisphaerales bacterium]